MRERNETVFKKLEILSNPTLIKKTEEEYEKIQEELALLESERIQKVYSEEDVKRVVRFGKNFIEHIDELVLESPDQETLAGFWELIFPTPPTLAEIKNRTLKISPIIERKDCFEMSENRVASPGGIEPPLPE